MKTYQLYLRGWRGGGEERGGEGEERWRGGGEEGSQKGGTICQSTIGIYTFKMLEKNTIRRLNFERSVHVHRKK